MRSAPFGFFMNWFGAQKGEGVEYHLLALALALPLLVRGGGLFSIDATLAARPPVGRCTARSPEHDLNAASAGPRAVLTQRATLSQAFVNGAVDHSEYLRRFFDNRNTYLP